MALSVWDVFLSVFRRSEMPDETEDADVEPNRFVPSPLDLSVRIAHGGPDAEIQREFSKIEEQAQAIERAQGIEQAEREE